MLYYADTVAGNVSAALARLDRDREYHGADGVVGCGVWELGITNGSATSTPARPSRSRSA